MQIGGHEDGASSMFTARLTHGPRSSVWFLALRAVLKPPFKIIQHFLISNWLYRLLQLNRRNIRFNIGFDLRQKSSQNRRISSCQFEYLLDELDKLRESVNSKVITKKLKANRSNYFSLFVLDTVDKWFRKRCSMVCSLERCPHFLRIIFDHVIVGRYQTSIWDMEMASNL